MPTASPIASPRVSIGEPQRRQKPRRTPDEDSKYLTSRSPRIQWRSLLLAEARERKAAACALRQVSQWQCRTWRSGPASAKETWPQRHVAVKEGMGLGGLSYRTRNFLTISAFQSIPVPALSLRMAFPASIRKGDCRTGPARSKYSSQSAVVDTAMTCAVTS
jgi:hypothetical protein